MKGGKRDIATKRFRDLTPQEKAKRYEYQKAYRKRIWEAARAAGIVGAPRTKLSEEEKRLRRREYRKRYNKEIRAMAKAYKELLEQQGTAPARRGRRKA